MGTQTYGIRVLDVSSSKVELQIHLLLSDWKRLPRSHGFAYELLQSHPAKHAWLQGQDWSDRAVYDKGREHVAAFVLVELANYPLTEAFLSSPVHPLDPQTGRFHAEEHLPMGRYVLTVHDAACIDHLTAGDAWSCGAGDRWPLSWYLESHKGQKLRYHHLYQDGRGRWCSETGPVGGRPRRRFPVVTHWHSAEHRMLQKLKKAAGYQLVYQNFDTEPELELKYDSAAERELAPRLLEVMVSNSTSALRAFLDREVPLQSLSEAFLYTLDTDYLRRQKLDRKRVNWSLLKRVHQHGCVPDGDEPRASVE